MSACSFFLSLVKDIDLNEKFKNIIFPVMCINKTSRQGNTLQFYHSTQQNTFKHLNWKLFLC